MADVASWVICIARRTMPRPGQFTTPRQSAILNAPADCQIHTQDCEKKEDHRNTPLIRQRSEEMLDHRAHATEHAAPTGQFADFIVQHCPTAQSRAGGEGQTKQYDKGLTFWPTFWSTF